LEPFPDVAEGLEMVARTHALVALTNAGTAQLHAMSRYARLRWTSQLPGQTVGAYKPDPRMYRALLDAFDLDPAGCVFVAAHPSAPSTAGPDDSGLRDRWLCGLRLLVR